MIISIVKLTIATFVPVGVTGVLHKLDKKGTFGKMSYATKQLMYGVIFGMLAVLGTEWGIPMNGVMINCRDAAPIIAGLMFGAPSGIIAGFIGGIERYIAVAWGVGSFTRVACSVSTAISGIVAAIIKKYLLENKKPTWGMALGVGVVMEVFHMNMVFITNIKDATKAIIVINTCFVPMVTAVGLSVMFATVVVSKMEGYFRVKIEEKQDTPIFETIQRWLLIVLAFVIALMSFFNYVVQSNMSNKQARDITEAAIREISQDISDASDRYMMQITRVIAREVGYGYYSMDELEKRYEFTELSVADENGIIIDSNVPEYLGFDMASGKQSAEFLCLLDGTKEYVQAYGPITVDNTVYRKYSGVAIRNGFVQMGYDADCFKKEVDKQLVNMANNKRVGANGGVIVIDDNNKIITYSKKLSSKYITDSVITNIQNIPENAVERVWIGDVEYYALARTSEGYTAIAIYPVQDAQLAKSVSVYISAFAMLLIFGIMYVLMYMLIKKIVVNQIVKMTESLSSITAGNLDVVVDVRSNKEFASLSDDINSTVTTLKRYIAEAAARIDKELEFAKAIQSSALPKVFPERDDYEIYASMFTAKEVGGDFYDFYMTNDYTLNFLIADVSGKGIPAAMYMMRAKSVLKSCTERGLSVDDVFTSGNDQLCSENDAGMFVTAWQGSLNLNDGMVYFANAGHNLPAVKHKGGRFELVKQKVNLVLGGMEGLPYTLNEMKLEPDDIIFLYTDGVTEATNAENELFGDERLIEALNSGDYTNTKEICDVVKQHVDDFVKDADQFDDITMVCLRYKG